MLKIINNSLHHYRVSKFYKFKELGESLKGEADKDMDVVLRKDILDYGIPKNMAWMEKYNPYRSLS